MVEAPVAGPTSGRFASASTRLRISASTLAVPTTVSTATGLSMRAMSRTLRTVCSTLFIVAGDQADGLAIDTAFEIEPVEIQPRAGVERPPRRGL